MRHTKGFTLIELMVAISIVAVLATIGLTLFSNAQKTGRDGKRRADISAIATNLESRWNSSVDQNCVGATSSYCPPLGTWFAGGTVPYDPLCTSPSTCPAGATAYSGIPVAVVIPYTICAKLEQAGGNASDNTGAPASGSTATFYCAKNRQQ